jgi:lipopolysaccharide exporter
MSSSKNRSLSGALIQGSVWAIAIRWGAKFLGLISLGICARILTPADYGLVNMAMVVVGFSQVLVEFGMDAALIRKRDATSGHYDTAWSIKVMQTLLISLIVFSAAPFAAKAYDDSRVMPIMFSVGAAGLVGGLQNIYVVNFRKELDFRRDFLFSFAPRLISFVVSVSAVLTLRSYWGLVLGICAAEVTRSLLSYRLVAQRPRWSLQHWRELTGFSLWYFLDGLAQYAVNHLDRAYIGKAGGSEQVGLYAVGREVATLPSTELVMPIGRALMPTLASLNTQKDRQIAAIQKAIAGVNLIAVPLAVGFALVASEFVRVLFGDKWMGAIPIVAIFSLTAMTSGFRYTAQQTLVVLGYVRVNAVLSWAYAITILVLIIPAFSWQGVMGVAWLYCTWTFVSTAAFGFYLVRLKVLQGSEVWVALLRVIVSATAMFFAVSAAAKYVGGPVLVVLVFKVVLSILVYGGLIYSFWVLAGRPDSSERIILEHVAAAWKKISKPLKRFS